MLEAWARNHVTDTLPDLVKAIDARFTSTLQERLELRRRPPEHKR
jgi:hypothetical protein